MGKPIQLLQACQVQGLLLILPIEQVVYFAHIDFYQPIPSFSHETGCFVFVSQLA